MLTETYCVNLPRSIVTDHYLLDHHTGGKPGQWDDGPANNCQFRMILKIILKKEGAELQAASSKLQFRMILINN
jgi:hypothetical protein